jgi:hypothetical protein
MMTIKEKLELAFKLLKEVADETNINLIDNYGYREYTAVESLRDFLPSIKKVIGRTGDDAIAPAENYFHIEQKSGTTKNKTLTMSSFPSMVFDKQNDAARRAYIYTYDGLSLSSFEYYKPYPVAVIFVTKNDVTKLHPLIEKKQEEKVRHFTKMLSEDKNIGRDSIDVTLEEIVECVGEKNLICWLHGDRIDSIEFFRKLKEKEIKINRE